MTKKSKSVTTRKTSNQLPMTMPKKKPSSKTTKKEKEPAGQQASFALNIPQDQPKVEVKLVLMNEKHFYKVGEDYLVSVTTILNSLAKGQGFNIWLQNHTAEEAEDILTEAGLAGSKIHKAISDMINGQRIIPSEFVYVDDKGVEHKGLDSKECQKLSTFVRWWYEYRPKVLANEKIVYSLQRKYAGTLDFIGSIKEGLIDKKSKTPDKDLMFIIDWKTSSGIYDSYEMQIAAYAQAEMEMTGKRIDKIAVLRLGTKHKAGYEFRVLDSIATPYKAFLGVYEAWKYQNPNFQPKVVEVPVYFELPKIEQVEVKDIKKRKEQTNANQGVEQHPEDAAAGSDQAGAKES